MNKAVKHDGFGGTSPMPSLSYIEDHEKAEAKKLIDNQFVQLTGRPFGFRPAGYLIACKLYVRPDELMVVDMPDGTKQTLYTAEVSKQQDVLTSVAALVCAIGPQAYKGFNPDGTPRFPEGNWCSVGDFIVLPRQSSFLCEYRGVKMAILPDDKVIGVIEDPADIAPIYVGQRV